MKSYTQCRNLYGKLTKNTSTTNLSHGDELINDEYRHLCSMGDFGFLHRTRTQSTIAGTQFQSFPYDVDVVESVSVTVSTKRYTPELIHTREEWDDLNLTSYTSDIPIKAFVFNGQLGIWPTPASNGNTITINAKIRVIDLSIADITSSTITTLTNGSTGLTVSGGLTTQMAGFWIRPTFSTTANTGDGQWYELSSVTNSTTGTLVRAYGGTSITAGTAAAPSHKFRFCQRSFTIRRYTKQQPPIGTKKGTRHEAISTWKNINQTSLCCSPRSWQQYLTRCWTKEFMGART